MKSRTILALFTAAAALLVAPHAQAQCVGVTPLQAFAGTWTFSMDGFRFLPEGFLGSAGRFAASVGLDKANNSIGLLAITQTASIDGSIVRYENDAGRYQANDDCTGGTLTFNVSSRPIQFDFFYVNANEIYFVGTNNGDIVQGSAKRFTGGVCPANPLDTLTGTWVFVTEGFQSPQFRFLGSAGRFVAGSNGLLVITQTAAIDGSVVRQETDAGKFQVNTDCTGGTLTFNVSSRPIQFDFYVVSANEIRIIGSNNGDIVVGIARRFGF